MAPTTGKQVHEHRLSPYHACKWLVADIADVVETGLKRRFTQLDLEQAVNGLDALDEVVLYPILGERHHRRR